MYVSCFEQRTADVMRIGDWSSDVCSSDLADQQVTARAANGILDGHTLSDGHVTDHAANVGKRGAIEVDFLVLRETRKIQGVAATVVPYRNHHFVRRRGGAVEVAKAKERRLGKQSGSTGGA